MRAQGSGGAEALVIAEDEQLVLDDGSAERTTELIAVELRLGGVEERTGVERAVAEELEGRAVDLVGAGADGGVTTAPPARPYSAGATLVSTRNSCMASAGGKKMMVFTSDSLLSKPSSRKLLAWGRRPFTTSAAPPVSL